MMPLNVMALYNTGNSWGTGLVTAKPAEVPQHISYTLLGVPVGTQVMVRDGRDKSHQLPGAVTDGLFLAW